MTDNTTTPQPGDPQQPWRMHYCSFGSGSSGNCTWVGNEREGILIDAGIDDKKVIDELRRNGVAPHMIKGIILTHDHADHIRYVYRLLRNNKHLRVYCTPKLMNGMLRRHNISNRIKEYHEPIFKEFPFKLAGLTITAFDTSHDATDNMGFCIEGGGNTLVVATDMGVVTERARHYIAQAQYLMIESNYDDQMLSRGRYPQFLKARVRGPKGHLDNVMSAQTVRELFSPKLQWVFLCHLSADNNTPEIALSTMRKALQDCGATVGDGTLCVEQRDANVQLYALPRFDTSTWFVL